MVDLEGLAENEMHARAIEDHMDACHNGALARLGRAVMAGMAGSQLDGAKAGVRWHMARLSEAADETFRAIEANQSARIAIQAERARIFA